MVKKSSNLCLSVDLTKWEDVVEAVELLGDKICMVKTHIDTIGLKGGRIIGEFWEKLKGTKNTKITESCSNMTFFSFSQHFPPNTTFSSWKIVNLVILVQPH